MADKWWREFQIQTDTSVSHPPPLPPLYPGTHLPHLFSGHLSPWLPASLPAALSPAPPVTSIASPPFIPRPRPLRASRLGSARSPEASLPPCSLLTSLQRVGHTVCPHTLGAMGPSSPWHPPSLPALTHLLAPFWETLLCPPLCPTSSSASHTTHSSPWAPAATSFGPGLCSELKPAPLFSPQESHLPQASTHAPWGALLSYPLPQGCGGSLLPHDWSGCISLPFTSLVNAFSLKKKKGIFSLMKYCMFLVEMF